MIVSVAAICHRTVLTSLRSFRAYRSGTRRRVTGADLMRSNTPLASQGERDQNLIGPDARHGPLVHRLRKDHRSLAGGQEPQQRDKLADGRGPQ